MKKKEINPVSLRLNQSNAFKHTQKTVKINRNLIQLKAVSKIDFRSNNIQSTV